MLSNWYRLHSAESDVCVIADNGSGVEWSLYLHLYVGEMKVIEIPIGRESKPELQKRKVELGNEHPRRNHHYLYIYLVLRFWRWGTLPFL